MLPSWQDSLASTPWQDQTYCLGSYSALVRQFHDDIRLFAYHYPRSWVHPGRVALLSG